MAKSKAGSASPLKSQKSAPTASGSSSKPSQKEKKEKKEKEEKEKPPAGRDIRDMFSMQPPKKKQPVKEEPIELDSSGEDVKPAAKPSSSKTPIAVISDSSDEDIKPSSSKHFASSATVKAPPSSSKQPSARAQAAPNKRKAKAESEEESDLEEDIKPPPKKRQSLAGGASRPTTATSSSKGKKTVKEEDSEEEYKMDVDEPPARDIKPKAAAKRPPVDESSSSEGEDDYDDDEDEDVKPKKKPAAKAKPAPPKKKATPKKATPKKEAASKLADAVPFFDFKNAAQRRERDGVPALEVPFDVAPNCLGGLTFVFTGELDSLAREEAQELVKRNGGRVTGAPSKKTSYVVVGRDAGPAKLKKIQEAKINTITEQELLDLVRYSGGAQLDDKKIAALEKQQKDIEKAAKEMAQKEAEDEALRLRKAKILERAGAPAKIAPAPSSQLWTTKYAPTKLSEICGNKGLVAKIGDWLEAWPANYRSNFKKPGKDGHGTFRALLLSGPPGIGKTTTAHLLAKLKGYSPIELNASDARSKKLIENATNIDNASLDSWFGGGGLTDSAAAGIRVNNRTCLIMDEVDGMSGGDRGGVGAMNVLIRKTKIPLILICNDKSLQKMKPLQTTTYPMNFRRPTAAEIRSRIMSILYKEKMKLDGNVVDQLVESSQADIRQVLNMLSTWKLSSSTMSFDEGKQLGQLNTKFTIQTPFTIIPQLLGPYSFSSTNRSSLNDKMELYFQDFSFIPLFMQENYAKNDLPAKAGNGDDPETKLQRLDLMSKAADSISDGDLIDRMIHGPEQHWSLLPVHAIASTVRPASFVYGKSNPTGGKWGGAGGYGPSFPQFLGQNSKRTKLARMLGDIQVKMRLKVTGSKDELRQDYMPLLSQKTVFPFTVKGADANEVVEQVIPYLDEYYLNKEDWDTLLELGVGPMQMESLTKLIPTATKSTFTRVYNKGDHPVAFHKADMFAAKKMVADKGPAPDLDDVFDDDDEVPAAESSEEGDENEAEANDIKKDKLIKVAGGKGKGKAAAKPKAAPKKK